MKKLIVLFIIVCISTLLFAGPKVINVFNEIPPELRGVWYSVSYSEDQGKTVDPTYRPLFSVTSNMVSSSFYSDTIEETEQVLLTEGLG